MELQSDVEITLDAAGIATFEYSPQSPGFNSYKFLQELEKRVGKIDSSDLKWYWCG
jgi:hypothetical protein